MKILHIVTSDKGGAGTAAFRLHGSLLSNGIDSKILCLYKQRTDDSIVQYKLSFSEKLKRFFSKKNICFHKLSEIRREVNNYGGDYELYSPPYSYMNIINSKLIEEADIIHLHWICGFLDYSSFFKNINKPIVWTMHDMNPFMGGFHYLNDKKRNKQFDLLENRLINEKVKDLSNVTDMTIISPSNWMDNNISHSSLFNKFPHYCIPNLINIEVYNIKNKIDSKKKFNIPLEKKMILFVSESISNKRKGFDYLFKAINNIKIDNIVWGVVGHCEEKANIQNILYFGYIDSDIEMSNIYNAADLFVIPSLEDNLPNTVIESMSCGTPVIGYKVGGIPEMIQNHRTGLIARELSTFGLEVAIKEALESNFNRSDIRKFVINKFSPLKSLSQHLYVYQCLINNNLVDNNK